MINNLFSKQKKEIVEYIKFLDTQFESNFASTITEAYRTKAKLISNYLNELAQKNVGDEAQIAIGNLGDQVESIFKIRGHLDRDRILSDLDTLMNFLGQVAQELFIRETRNIGKAAIEILDYFYYSVHRNDDEKYLGLMLTAKLPMQIYNETISSRKDTASAKVAELELKTEELNKKYEALGKSEQEVSRLSEALQQQRVSFNFLGLSKAFSQFYRNKKWHKLQAFGIMFVIGVMLVVIPLISLSNLKEVVNHQDYLKKLDNEIAALNKVVIKKEKEKQVVKELKEINVNIESLKKELDRNSSYKYLFLAIPILTIELILLYFFRIALLSYTNSRSQMMQLELRNSVCQFIETYVNFRRENKEAESGFEKFEALVFSGLAPNDAQIPSTFDGLEQLGKMIKDIKGS